MTLRALILLLALVCPAGAQSLLGVTMANTSQGGPIVYDSAATAIFNAMATTPTTALKGAINTNVLCLKSASIWTSLDALWVGAVQDSTSSLLNWIAPGTFTLTLGGATVGGYTPYRGYQGDASAFRLVTGFTPSVNGVNCTLNSCSEWAYITTQWGGTGIGNAAVMGGSTNPLGEILAANTSSTIFGGINQAALANFGANAGGLTVGFWGMQRSGATTLKGFKNGAQVGSTQSTASSALASQVIWITGANSSAFTQNEVPIAAIGASLAGSESAFYTCEHNYLNSVLDNSTWQTGKPVMSFYQTANVSFGSHAALNLERTQAWTAIAAIRVFSAPTTVAEIIFTNVTTGAAFPGYELWIDSSCLLRTRLINNVAANANMLGVIGSHSVCDGNWHVVAETYDGTSTPAGVQFYIDGVADTGQTTESNTLTSTIVSGTQTFLLGNQTNHTDFPLHGQMGYFSLANVVRSAGYIAGITASTPETVNAAHILFAPFTEGTGLTTADTSTNAFSGLLQSGVTNNATAMWRPQGP